MRIVIFANNSRIIPIANKLLSLFDIKVMSYAGFQSDFGSAFPQYGDTFFDAWNRANKEIVEIYKPEMFSGDLITANYFRKLIHPRLLAMFLAEAIATDLKRRVGYQFYLFKPYENPGRKYVEPLLATFRAAFGIPLVFGILVLDWLRYVSHSLTSRVGSKSIPDILYLRKKIAPDLLRLSDARNYFESRGLSFSPAYALFSRDGEQYGIVPLGSYAGSVSRINRQLAGAIRGLLTISYLNIAKAASIRDLLSYFRDDFLARIIMGMGSKVVFGVLSDKPRFILLSRHRRGCQSVVTLTDGFSFSPMPSANYVHADYYLASNALESMSVNTYGGNIGRVVSVGFFRGNVGHTSKGISKPLADWAKGYPKVVLVLTSQISVSGYGIYSLESLKMFLRQLVKVASSMGRVGFIIKEKKGELGSQLCDVRDQENIFVVRSGDPKFIEYNDFNYLLGLSSCVISYAINSTVIFQSIYSGVPVLVYNGDFKSSIWKAYNGLEVGPDDLYRSIAEILKEPSAMNHVYNRVSEDLSIRTDGFQNILSCVATIASALKDDTARH